MDEDQTNEDHKRELARNEPEEPDLPEKAHQHRGPIPNASQVPPRTEHERAPRAVVAARPGLHPADQKAVDQKAVQHVERKALHLALLRVERLLVLVLQDTSVASKPASAVNKSKGATQCVKRSSLAAARFERS